MLSIDQLIFALMRIAALGCGLVAGIVFAFSTFVMKALSRLPGGWRIAGMQSINVAVLNRWFMTTFFGPDGIFGSMARSARHMLSDRQHALPDRRPGGDDRVQYTQEQYARSFHANRCEERGYLGRPRRWPDGLEPCSYQSVVQRRSRFLVGQGRGYSASRYWCAFKLKAVSLRTADSLEKSTPSLL